LAAILKNEYNDMTDEELKSTDPEDIEYLLLKVESSLGIKLVENELGHIKTFGEFCDYIADKIQLNNSNDCTTQQAFYKLRSAVETTLQLDRNEIIPNLELTELLPRKNRKTLVKNLESKLDFRLDILSPPDWIVSTLVVLLLCSLVGLFIKWQFGLLGLVISIFGFWISAKLGNELNFQTLGQIAEKMTRDNYLKARRNSKTFNKYEIEKVLTDLFATDLALDKSLLTRDSTFA
jgi:divalent metal cation (Fe/Co/Zn/Cd) transporter